jgi:pimeloyl-ACP methyl ester carboxylesterase
MTKSALLIVSSIVIAIFWYISPLIKPFPPLTGSHQVGIETVYFIDQKRIESFSENPTDKRTIVGHIFFPTDNVIDLKKAPYLGNKMPIFQKIFSDFYDIPERITKLFFRNVTTNAYLNASLSQSKSKYPIVLFSHGLLGFPSDMHVVFLEDLASHGYIVIGIDHPYFNLITVYPNDNVISSTALTKKFEKMSPIEQQEFQNKAIDIYKSDIQFILDQLAIINQNPKSTFYNHLDLDHIGVMGHSAGGTAAIELCRTDDRCKAAIDLDGWYDQAIGHEPIQQPLLLLFGSKSIDITELSRVEFLILTFC